MNRDSINILLVEDNPADVDLMSEAFALGEIRPRIEVASDGLQAVKRLCSPEPGFELPQLVLLDLNLPRMDGRKVLSRIRQHERTKSLPVIVITSSNAELDISVSYQLGANCVVTKPLEFSAFRKLIREIEGFWFNLVSLPGEN